ncbi:hypothetical protein PRUPE_8G042700 [Prunus persica]|uniref:RNase H type-1 domain-containing protein n=1 Tax=Prunus persica TaxID=3760 RepID=A0A251MSW7_PRUPE|nr:hypothetical protein PRUPE_8G042700 [Prunus persica]
MSDRLVWPRDRNGCYSVKSGYHWLHSVNVVRRLHHPSSSTTVDTDCWKMMWKTNAPPQKKIKTFLWRALRNAIAAFVKLFIRKCSQTPLYPLCNCYPETVKHMLLLCSWVETIRFGSPLSLRVDKCSISTLDVWLCNTFFTIGTEQNDGDGIKTTICFLCWHIWKERCKAVIEQCSPSSRDTIQRASNVANEFLSSRERYQANHNPRPKNLAHNTAWSAPLSPLVKLNVDAAWDPISKSVGIGMVVRDHNGQFLEGKSLLAQADSTLLAECLACLERCRFASNRGDQLVSFEFDCLEAVKSINGDISRGKWEIYPILSNIRDFLLAFRSCSWTWIRRIANEAADHLAQLAKSRMCNEVWAYRPPSSLTFILNKDGLPCPPNKCLV